MPTPPVVTNRQTLTDSVDRSSYTIPSFTLPPHALAVVFFEWQDSVSPTSAPSSYTGHSLTWTEVAVEIRGINGMSCIVAKTAAAGSTGTIVVNFPFTAIGLNASVESVADCDLTGTALNAIVQFKKLSVASQVSPWSLALDSAPASSSRCLVGFGISSNAANAPRTNWTELSDIGHATPNSDMHTQWRDDAAEQTASTSGWGGGVAVRGIHLELKAGHDPRQDARIVNATGPAVRRAATW